MCVIIVRVATCSAAADALRLPLATFARGVGRGDLRLRRVAVSQM